MNNPSLLKSNFQEIYASLHDPHTSLVASAWGNRIYLSSVGWGRMWSWFYFFAGSNRRETNLEQAIQHTKTIFEENLVHIQKQAGLYEAYLKKLKNGLLVKDEKIHEVRKDLIEWYHATRPLLKIKSSFPFKGEDFTYLIKIIKFEGIFKESLPIYLLFSIVHPTVKPTDKENHLFKEWVCNLDNDLSRAFHHFLTSIFRVVGDSQFNLPEFEKSLLMNQNIDIFYTIDKRHDDWRKSLKPGDILTLNGSQYVIGEQLGKKEEGKIDHTLIFSILGDTERVIIIGMNRVFLNAKKLIGESVKKGLPAPLIYEIEPSGKFALMERLEHSVTKEQLIEFISSTVNEKEPFNASCELKYLMINKKGKLCSVKNCQTTFDFNKIEDIIREYAKGDLETLKYIVKKSQVATANNAQLYQKAAKYALWYSDATFASLVSNTPSPDIQNRGQTLMQNLRAHQLRLQRTKGITASEACTLVLKAYEETCSIGLLNFDAEYF